MKRAKYVMWVAGLLLANEKHIRSKPEVRLAEVVAPYVSARHKDDYNLTNLCTRGVCSVFDLYMTGRPYFINLTIDELSLLYSGDRLYPVEGTWSTKSRRAAFVKHARDEDAYRAAYMWGWSLYANHRWDFIKFLYNHAKRVYLSGSDYPET